MFTVVKLSTKLVNQRIGGIHYNGVAQKYARVNVFSRGMAQKRPSMEEYFEGKKFIVTGAGSGNIFNID